MIGWFKEPINFGLGLVSVLAGREALQSRSALLELLSSLVLVHSWTAWAFPALAAPSGQHRHWCWGSKTINTISNVSISTSFCYRLIEFTYRHLLPAF
jgi:hypothetical protein